MGHKPLSGHVAGLAATLLLLVACGTLQPATQPVPTAATSARVSSTHTWMAVPATATVTPAPPTVTPTVTPPTATPTGNPLAWRLPPAAPVDGERKGPRLVNYAHRHDMLHGVHDIEERLAQWDVVILNPDHHLSLDRMRETNPDIKILMWIPMQGPHRSLSLHRGFQSQWFLRTVDGALLIAPWGEPLANPYADSCGYVYHVLDYLQVRRQRYDGVLYDCLWTGPRSGADANEDGILDDKDVYAFRTAMTLLLRETRERFPDWVVTGNGGLPWPPGSAYYEPANGNMHENALGDQFGDPGWNYLWSMYNTVAAESQSPVYHFINVDLRANGRTQSQAAGVTLLTESDLRRMRLGLVGSMLLDSGYFGFDRGDCLHGQLWWFDEYDVDMGDALGPYSQSVYGPGTFSREFENGIVILNSGDSSIRVDFDTPHFDVSLRVEGTSFLIPSNDARILLVGRN